MNKKTTPNQRPIVTDTAEHQMNTNALRSAIVLLLAAAFNGMVALRQAIQSTKWQARLEAGVVFAFLILIVYAIFLIHRRHTQRGINLLLISFLVTLFIRNALTADMGLLYGLVALTVVSVIAFYTMPPDWATRTAVAGLLVGVLLILFDLYAPAYRQSAPEAISKSLPVVAGITSLIFIFVGMRYFRQMNLQTRLTALILIALVPLLVGITVFISSRAGAEIERQANGHIEDGNASLASNVSTWLELHYRTLQEITLLPDVISMDAALQRPNLKAIAAAHPNLFLVQTTDLNGINIARNDEDELKDYHDRGWFLGAKAGAPITYEVLISRTTGAPALNMSRPIRDESGQIIGVASMVSELNEISQEVLAGTEGQMITYIVDAANRVVAHPDPTYTEGEELKDLSTYPPVAALRQGQTGIFSFTDESGEVWRAYVSTLENGWGVIAQQPEAELLASVRKFQRVAYTLITVGTAMMLILAWWVIRRMIHPIGVLTEAASAIAAGDLSRKAEVTSQDEIGVLATTFNTMTAQLRDLIGSLEQRVESRTKALTSVAEVGTAASTILETNKLLQMVVDLAKERFEFYHAHIYLMNEAGDALVLTSGAGDVGKQMVDKGFSIPLNREQSLVARAAREKKGVTVNDVTTAPDFLPNPLLPHTRSELAVPMMIGEQVIGVFDVQSETVGRFTDSDIAVQTTLAAQVASTIQNARSYTELQRSQALLSDALKAARLGNWEYDFEKDLFTFSDEFYAIFRTTAEQVGGYKISSADYAKHFVHPDDAPLVGAEIQKVLDAKDRHFTTHLEHRIIFSNGETGYIAVNINVERDENGKIVRWYGANQDITERRQLEELNRERARQQESINMITQRIQAATTVESALQIAARELGHALGMKPTLVTLDPAALTSEE